MDNLWSLGSRLAETARDVLTEEVEDGGEGAARAVVEAVDKGATGEQGEELVEAVLLEEALADVDRLTSLCEKQRTELGKLRQESEELGEVRAELGQLKSRLRKSETDRDALEKQLVAEATRVRDEENARRVQAEAEWAKLRLAAEARVREEETAKRRQSEAEWEKEKARLNEALAKAVEASHSVAATAPVVPSESSSVEEEVAAAVAQVRKEEATKLREAENRWAQEKEILQRQLVEREQSHSDGGNWRLQVESLAAQLETERQGFAEERAMESKKLQAREREMEEARDTIEILERKLVEAGEREQQAVRALTAAKEKNDLLRAHLLEREDEQEQMSGNLMANKEAIVLLQSQLSEAQAALSRIDELEELLAEKDRRIARTEKALANLEEAVGQMSEDHRSEMLRKEKLLKEKFHDEFLAKLQMREKELAAANATTAAKNRALEEEMSRLMGAVMEKEKKIESLLNEVGPLREALTETMKKLTEAIDKDQFAVDKRLVANLVFSYFSNDKNKKAEVLSLMLRILDVPKHQRDIIYARIGGGWFGGGRIVDDEVANGFPAGASAAGQNADGNGRSLGDMWIEYLLKEAERGSEQQLQQPQPPPK